MRPSASGFGFGGTAGCAGMPVEGRGEAAQSVRLEGDRSFGFWPRTTSRGSACAGESAQAVVSLRRGGERGYELFEGVFCVLFCVVFWLLVGVGVIVFEFVIFIFCDINGLRG
jgi:hypothetical protein